VERPAKSWVNTATDAAPESTLDTDAERGLEAASSGEPETMSENSAASTCDAVSYCHTHASPLRCCVVCTDGTAEPDS